MNWETLLAFGDSITFGARSYLSYPEICSDMLSKKLNKSWHVINHSTNGFTTLDLMRSIDPQLMNYKSNFPSIITVMIGTNDIKQKIQAELFRIAYNQLVIKLQLLSVNNNVLLIKIPKITNDVFYPYTFSMNDEIKKFNEIIDEIAMKSNLRCIEFEFNDKDYFDGVHLNTQGTNTAAIQLYNYILKDKGFEGSSALS